MLDKNMPFDIDAIPGERWFPKETNFTDDIMEYWGDWGVSSEVATLKAVLMRRPGKEIEDFDASKAKDNNNNGRSPLHFASMNGHLNIIQYLSKECNCDVDSEDNNGYTPLHIASRYGYLNIVQYLVEKCHAEITDGDISWAKNDEIKNYLRSKK